MAKLFEILQKFEELFKPTDIVSIGLDNKFLNIRFVGMPVKIMCKYNSKVKEFIYLGYVKNMKYIFKYIDGKMDIDKLRRKCEDRHFPSIIEDYACNSVCNYFDTLCIKKKDLDLKLFTKKDNEYVLYLDGKFNKIPERKKKCISFNIDNKSVRFLKSININKFDLCTLDCRGSKVYLLVHKLDKDIYLYIMQSFTTVK